MQINTLFATLAALSHAFAHPGHDVSAEAAAYERALAGVKRNLDHCSETLMKRGISGDAINRRAAVADVLREKRGPEKRGKNEHGNNDGFTAHTSPEKIFAGNHSCSLAPEDADSGPFWVVGENIRKDLAEDQVGIPIHVDIQIINSATCEPVVGAFVDIWNCNSTGVYSGTVSDFDGTGNDYSNWETTWLRGIQPTDLNGVAQFDTIFPGHYLHRASHIHTLVHHSSVKDPAIPQRNHTLLGNTASHVGQLFFDQDLRDEIEKIAPYSTNHVAVTSNADDPILSAALAHGGYPFFQYTKIGDRLEDGLLVWISVGVNVTYSRTVCAIATNLAEGGHVPSGSTPPNCISTGASPL